MTSVPANLIINFTANVIGIHRVCYRLGSSGSYTCVDVTCATLGTHQAVVPIYLDNDSCENVQYTGYVQAGCEDISSETGRVSWSADVTPVPGCKAYTVTCARLNIDSVSIDDGGSGYLTPPTVSFVGGGGAATGTAQIGAGGVIDTTISNPGSGYTGGGGTGFVADVTIAGEMVTNIDIVNAGVGYGPGDVLVPLAAEVGGAPGVEAQILIESDLQTVIGVTDIVTTTQYTSEPAVVFTGGSGTGANGAVALEQCPEVVAPGCIGSDGVVAAGVLDLGESVVVCDTSQPSQAVEYDVTQEGNCLCSCTQALIGVSGEPGDQVRATWNKCGLERRSLILTVGGSPSQVVDCVVPGSLKFQILTDGAAGTVEYGSACD
jgi:hypothetical protein